MARPPAASLARAAVLALGGLAGAVSASAQTRAEAVSFAAYFMPLRDVAPGVRHRQAPMAGLRLGSWVTPWLGFEMTFGYADSDLRGAAAPDTDVILTVIRGRVLVTSWRSNTHVFVSAGLGGISHGGASYGTQLDAKDLTLTAGLGARLKLRGRFGLRIELEDYHHRARLVGEGRRAQHDLVLSLALAVGFGPGWPGLTPP
ncbi:MAG TPA: outer membrane beta-barrel protein [Gemmatimonadales bacterium]|nr:outer membrane beta-barrel protein [Gemmatimonadales bacterium]